MGSGAWTARSFADYTVATKNMSVDDFASTATLNATQVYKSYTLDKALNPFGITRECCDSEEHPNTLPVILALDVTGSMGKAAVKVAQKLGEIMTDLYSDDEVKDVEFCVMGIGDLAYDNAPIQMSQFESDIRIAEQLDKIYFEGGGGGNLYESYTAAWYMGVNHCKLDCWDRGQKGIIITLGDEAPNPFLPASPLNDATGDHVQPGTIETTDLKEEASKKFNLYHISIKDSSSSYERLNERYDLDTEWHNLLGDNYKVASLDNLANTVVDIIKGHNTSSIGNEVSW